MTDDVRDPGRYLLRPATPGDLAAFERIAGERAIGISSLPVDRAEMLDRLARSERAFASEDDASGEEIYLFALVDQARDGRVVGTSGIAASAGFHDRFYGYRNEFILHASPALGERHRVHTLHLCHDLTGVTLLTGFHIAPEYADTPAAQLLSRGRLMFLMAAADRFASDRVASEHPGLADPSGRCPFWDGIGRRFFGMDFASAERLIQQRGRALIEDLMPQTPVYVPLLPEESQWAIGQLHPVAELPFGILQDEGFDSETWINIFDGGPTAEARIPLLKSVQRLRRHAAGDPVLPRHRGPGLRLISRAERAAFRAVLARADAQGIPAPSDAAAAALKDVDGAWPALLVTALDATDGEST